MNWTTSIIIIIMFVVAIDKISAGLFPKSFYISNIGKLWGYQSQTDDDDVSENSVDNNNNENNFKKNPSSVRSTQSFISEEDFTALRIEFIKMQILKKLRLKETPQVSMINDLPKPIKDNENFFDSDKNIDTRSSYDNDFYGKTTSAIILPYEDEAECNRKMNYPSTCLPFQLPNDIHNSDVSKVELWVHKKSDIMDSHNQTFIIYEVTHWDTKKSFQKSKPIAIKDTNIKEGWLTIDVTYVVKNWLDFQETPIHALNIICKTCGKFKTNSPISSLGDLRPFLIIHTHAQHRRLPIHRRPKRSTDCRVNSSECCRESLYISFKEIQFDHFIYKPDGYQAYFCRGSCNTPESGFTSKSHTTILQKVMGNNNLKTSRPELTPCCAASQYGSLSLIYRNNKTVINAVLSDMIVESCSCI